MVDGDSGGEGGTGGTGAGAQELGGGGAAPEWLGALPDDLQADKTLARFKSVEELARGHVEAHKVAKSKLAIPAPDAGAEVWDGIWTALGRPEDAKGYEIPLPDGVKEESPMAAAFREEAFKLGLLPNQVKGAVNFFNGQIAATEAAWLAEGEAEVAAVRTELGAEYDGKREAAKAAIGKIFDTDDVDLLDRLLGSGRLIRGAIKLAELTGEHGRVDDDDKGGLGAGTANAEAQLEALQADKTWRDKLNAGDVATIAQRDRLLKAAQAQALKGGT